jgi:hypothetical protein
MPRDKQCASPRVSQTSKFAICISRDSVNACNGWFTVPAAHAVASTSRTALQQNRTYFSELAGRGWLLVALFALVFYGLCFLCSRRTITTDQGSILLAGYWAGSALYFARVICRDFPKLYGAVLRRFRLYSPVRKLVQWFLGFPILFVPVLIHVFMNYNAIVQQSLLDYSIKLLIGVYGGSLFSVMFIYTVVCNFVAESRGVRRAK